MSPPYPERKFAAFPMPNQLVAQCVIASRQRAKAAGAQILRLEAPRAWTSAPWLGEDVDRTPKANY